LEPVTWPQLQVHVGSIGGSGAEWSSGRICAGSRPRHSSNLADERGEHFVGTLVVARRRVDVDACRYLMYYNFARVHQTLRVTPAMEAGLADHVWVIEEIVAFLW
jgi:hypothetical protein